MHQEVLDALFLAYTNYLIYRQIERLMCAGKMACLWYHACNNARANCLIKDEHPLSYLCALESVNAIRPGFF